MLRNNTSTLKLTPGEEHSVPEPTLQNNKSMLEPTLEANEPGRLIIKKSSSSEHNIEVHLRSKAMPSALNVEATQTQTDTEDKTSPPYSIGNQGIQTGTHRNNVSVAPQTVTHTNIYKTDQEANITTYTTKRTQTNSHTPSLFNTYRPSQSWITHRFRAHKQTHSVNVQEKEEYGDGFLQDLPPFLKGSVVIERADLYRLGNVAISDSYGTVTYQQ